MEKNKRTMERQQEGKFVDDPKPIQSIQQVKVPNPKDGLPKASAR